MAEPTDTEAGPTWHQALAYALLGRRLPGLGTQQAPDLQELRGEIEATVGVEAVVAEAGRVRHQGQAWPHPVPAELMAGLGRAQFGAALAALRGELGVGASAPRTARVGRAAPAGERVSADVRRLLDEVPPHHGS